MANEDARALRQQGIAAAKAGRRDEARSLLQQAIRLEPANEAAWMWLASVARDQRERVFALQKLLEVNPDNLAAQQALAALQATAPAEAATPAPSASPFTVMPEEQPGTAVPMPSADAVAQAYRQAESALQAQIAAANLPPAHWMKKTRGRAGERDADVLRLQVLAGAAAVFAVLVCMGLVLITTNEGVRAVVFAPTLTFTPTPTVTHTPTPGLTPTPSAEPRVPPTGTPVPPVYMSGADRYNLPQATALYPAVLEKPLEEAISAFDRGEIASALAAFSAEREATVNEFRMQPYYYEIRTLITQGELNDARALLEEAEGRMTGRTTATERALLESALAQLALAEGAEALTGNQRTRARALFDEATEHAGQALELDARLPEPYLVMAQVYRENREFDAAIETLDRGLDADLLPSNVDLLVEKGRVYFDQGEYDLADAQAALALYVDPRTADAHELRITASLALDEPGRAVLQAQDYLYYVPGSVTAWRLLGDARLAEGNPDLALVAYSQALMGPESAYTRDTLLSRAGLYAQRRQWELAREDLTAALAIEDDPATRALRMQAAFHEGRFAVAAEDAEALQGTDALPAAELALWTGRIVLGSADSETEYARALNTLAPLTGEESGLRSDLRPLLYESLARAHLGMGDAETALGFIEQALAAGSTPLQHFVRGQVFEALDENEAARREYDWVLTWASFAPLAIEQEAADRLAALD